MLMRIELKRINLINEFCLLKVYVGALSLHYEALSVEASKQTTAEEIVSCIVERLGLPVSRFIKSYHLANRFTVLIWFSSRERIMSWPKWQASARKEDYPPMRSPSRLCCCGQSMPKEIFIGE